MSKGTPTNAAFRPCAECATGRRIMLAMPPKRGMALPDRGWFLSMVRCLCIEVCKKVAQLGIGNLLFGEAEAALLLHFLGCATDQAEGAASQAAADADALDSQRVELRHRENATRQPHDDIDRAIDLTH